MSNEIAVTFIMPAYNEAKSIVPALESLEKQKLEHICLRIIIVANGCTDSTAAEAKKFARQSKLSMQVIETEVKQKGNAINLGLGVCNDKIVLYGDADCIFDEFSVTRLVSTLTESKMYALAGGLDIPNFSRSNANSMLCGFQKIMQVERVARGRILAVGRLVAINREMLPEFFPTDIHSEDTWITLLAAKKYGFRATKIVTEARVYFYPPLNWQDFLAQETRYEMSMDQLFDKFPELSELYDHRRDHLAAKSKEDIERDVQFELGRLGIAQDERLLLHSFFDTMVEEDARYFLRDFIRSNGRWDPVITTK